LKIHSIKQLSKLRLCAIALLALPFVNAHADDAPKKCRYVNLKTLPLNMDRGTPRVSGSINGAEFPMIIDTGADKTTLLRWVVDKLEMPLAHTNVSAIGVGGESANYIATANQFAIGPMGGNNLRLKVAWNTKAIQDAAALIGVDFLLQDDVEISMKEMQLRFFRPLNCGDAFLGYWSQDASYVPLENGNPDEVRPVVVVELNGKPIRALVDTGAVFSVVSLAAAARAGVTPSSPHVIKDVSIGGVGEHHLETWIAPFSTFAIGPEVSEHLHLRIGDIWAGAQADIQRMGTSQWLGEQPEMILGMDFLRHHRMLFSKSQHRLYFTYEGGALFAPASKN
jgi:predicted aspartyl protease